MRGCERAIVPGLVACACAAVLAACGGSHHTSSGRASTTTTSHASYTDLVGAGIDLLNERNFGAAEQVFAQAIAKQPRVPVAYYDLGLTFEQDGQPVRAKQAYQGALQVAPGYVPAMNNLAFMLISRDPQLATYYFQVLNTYRPHSPTVLLHLGLLFAANQRTPPPVSVKDLSAAVRLEPGLLAQIPRRLRPYLRIHSATH